jgi:hypothetical protein
MAGSRRLWLALSELHCPAEVAGPR